MKKTTLLAGLVFATVAANAAEISKLVVRQNWPWTPDVRVDYTLTGVSGPTDVAIKCYRGSTELAVPTSAISGKRYAVSQGGDYTIVLDVAKVFGASQPAAIDDFRVELTPTASTAKMSEVLYRDYDLVAKTITDITRGDLLNGDYGAVETSYQAINPTFTTPLSDVVIWTGVTNDEKWATSHLVMRKVSAVAMSPWTMCPACSGFDSTREKTHQVSFTKDFWVSVFELTNDQYTRVTGVRVANNANFFFTNELYVARRPAVQLNYNAIRGATTDGIDWPNGTDPHAVKASSVLGKLRAHFPSTPKFDLCTEAQWEFAARAGSTTRLYSGSDRDNEGDDLLLARLPNNGGASISYPYLVTNEEDRSCGYEKGLAAVGSYAPNAFGLYDMYGNAWEWCLDWVTRTTSDFPNDPDVDPKGLTSGGSRSVRGGAFDNSYKNARSSFRHYTSSDDWTIGGTPRNFGCFSGVRLCITEE